MRLFRRAPKATPDPSEFDPAGAFTEAARHWVLLAECRHPHDTDATMHLTEVMRLSQLGVSGGARDALPLLAAAYLLAASVRGLTTIPSEAATRFAGLAAAAVTRAALLRDPDYADLTPLGRVVAERYKVVRSRLRGSVYVPRDVESAFAGEIDGLRALAFEPGRFTSIRGLLAATIEASRAANRSSAEAATWDVKDAHFLTACVEALAKDTAVRSLGQRSDRVRTR